nr:MAG TPA: hypothetical protein [Bacteriophage sp.]
MCDTGFQFINNIIYESPTVVLCIFHAGLEPPMATLQHKYIKNEQFIVMLRT